MHLLYLCRSVSSRSLVHLDTVTHPVAFISTANSTDFVNKNAKELSSLLLGSAVLAPSIHTSKYGYHAATHAVRHCLKSQTFLKEFVAEMIQRTTEPEFPISLMIFVVWSSLCLGHLDPNRSEKAIDKVIESQSIWLDVLESRNKTRYLKTCYRAIERLLGHKRTIMGRYFVIADAKASGPLVRIMWHAIKSMQDDAQIAETSEKLFKIFVDKVLSTKDKTPERVLRCYSELLQSASDDQIKELMAVALRMIRRSPEAALSTVAFMFQSFNQDLSKYAPDIAQFYSNRLGMPKKPFGVFL